MIETIRHRRLYAFYRSNVLNSLMVVIGVSIMLMQCTNYAIVTGLCAALSMLFLIGYSLWIWIAKPKSIVINRWLSDTTTYFVLYFLIITAMKSANQWWYITPVILAVILLFVALIRPKDEIFTISE